MLVLDSPANETVRNKFLIFKPSSLCYIVTVAWEDKCSGVFSSYSVTYRYSVNFKKVVTEVNIKFIKVNDI